MSTEPTIDIKRIAPKKTNIGIILKSILHNCTQLDYMQKYSLGFIGYLQPHVHSDVYMRDMPEM